MTTLTLVIPCYNESKNLPFLVERCNTVFMDSAIQVIFVDNGSTDDSSVVLQTLLAGKKNLRFIRVEKNQGYGFGILQGLKAADTEFLAWTHADMQTDPNDVMRAYELLKSHQFSSNIFIKGTRKERPLGDAFFTFGMSVFETLLLGVPLNDINAQPTVFHRNFFSSWANPPFDFSLDLFAFYQAKKQKLTALRFPVYFGKRLHGVSHWNINWQAKIKFIKRTINYSLALRRKL